jgi:uncharacterized membrane protein HdeD (DUF308 family)
MGNQLLTDILNNGKEKYKFAILISIIVVIFGSVCIVISLFPTSFGNLTVDYFAFAAGILLISDALYKLRTDSDKAWNYQVVRFCRLIIGVCIFSVHAMQFIYKV